MIFRSGMDRAVVITGASGAMGSEAVRAMAAKGRPVVMACRNLEKAASVREGILKEHPGADITPMLLDVGSTASVREFAAALEGRELAGLFNCAGVISRSFGLSPDGFERTMAVNCIGPMLLSTLLLPLMEPGAHIVNMVSLTSKLAHIDRNVLAPGQESRRFKRLKVYGRSKLALLLMSLELADRATDGRLGEDIRAKGIHVNVADPGIVDSNMISMGKWFDPLADTLFRPLCKRPSEGAAPAVRALEADCSGMYFVGNRITAVPQRISRHPLREWLWEEISEAALSPSCRR